MKLTIVGDIFPGDEGLTVGYGIKSLFSDRSFRNLWQSNIRGIIGNSDCVIGNLESPLIDECDVVKSSFYGFPEFADFLKKCGFTALNIANNHILEHGEKGFISTLRHLMETRITIIGNETDNKPHIAILEHDNIKIAIAGFCDKAICHVPYISGTYNRLEESEIVDTVNRMKNIPVDIRAIVLHWGNEYVHFPSLTQRQLAHKLVDMGVNLIIGHHPHCIQPYEEYGGGHIFYSLGNFCFDFLHSNKVKKGLTAQITITKKGIEQVQLIGVDLYDTIYSNQLVKIADNNKFNKYYSKINNKYKTLLSLTDQKYEDIYIKTHKKNRFVARLNMRRWMIFSMFSARICKRKMLIKNIWNFMKNKCIN